ncbi:MAG: hypothetical protein Q9182_006456 [Xanthomendoza sp. 2 TL-2023]
METTKWKTIIFGLAGLGLYGTWGRAAIDGSLMHLQSALHKDGPHLMSGTQEPLMRSITGIYWPIDYFLDVLILFFWEVVDGSHPATSLVSLYFGGQLLSLVVMLYIDSSRSGNRKEWRIGATLWTTVFQITAIGTSGPWFLVVYFAISPLADMTLPLPRYLSGHLADPLHILCLPVSATVGYILPIIVMSLRSPSVLSATSKQLAIAVWNAFPLIMAAVQVMLYPTWSFLSPPKSVTKQTDFLRAVRICYVFSLTLSSVCHISIAVLSAVSVLLPMVFAPNYVSKFRPETLLVLPFSWTAVPTLGEGALSFMKWDQVIGYACMLLYTGVSYRQAQEKLGVKKGWVFYAAMVGGCAVIGPGSTALAINWNKDELLFAKSFEGRRSASATNKIKGSHNS